MKLIRIITIAFLLFLGSCHPVHANTITTATRCIDGKLFVIAYASNTQSSGVGITQVLDTKWVSVGVGSDFLLAPVECTEKEKYHAK